MPPTLPVSQRPFSRRPSRRLFAVCLALAAMLHFSPAWAAAPLKVVASFSILADMARQVGGSEVEVASLVGPDGDAHVYQPTPADAQRLLAAHLFIVNGLGFEGWMSRLVKAAQFKGTVVVTSEGIDPLHLKEEAEEAGKKDHADHHHEGDIDPHAWHDLTNARRYVANIAEAMIRLAPEREAVFRANAQAYDRVLADLDQWTRGELEAIPPAQRKVITTHDAFGYFARAYGVTFLSPMGVSSDAEPSARDVARLALQAKREGIRAIFLENMSNPRLMRQLTSEIGAQLGGTLYADALSQPDGPAPDFIALIRRNVTLLKQAMSGSNGR